MRTLPLLALTALLIGCSGSTTESSKADSDATQANFSRGLTPEEKAKMGGGAAAPGAPDKTPSGG